jgi:hypothetical protein
MQKYPPFDEVRKGKGKSKNSKAFCVEKEVQYEPDLSFRELNIQYRCCVLGTLRLVK